MILDTQLWVTNPGRDLMVLRPVEEKGVCGWQKPSGGGLWTSTKLPDGSSGWTAWCLGEEFAGPDFDVWELEPDPSARVYTIDAYADLAALAEAFPPVCDHHDRPCLPGHRRFGSGVSWRRVAAEYDAVHLTDEGQWRTRMSDPHSLYGWDCESTLWFRHRFARVEFAGRRTFTREQVDA